MTVLGISCADARLTRMPAARFALSVPAGLRDSARVRLFQSLIVMHTNQPPPLWIDRIPHSPTGDVFDTQSANQNRHSSLELILFTAVSVKVYISSEKHIYSGEVVLRTVVLRKKKNEIAISRSFINRRNTHCIS
ncbi:hypothetical protein NIES4073_46730 [Kalymmatonema gypsitolerans NIES-4073]|nr:hypothetical protein NIES4073_46730 [Scytonema sp. NIES-4073]